MPIKNFRELEVYNLAYELALGLHKILINSKKFELARESTRSMRSIPTNIAEGFSRRSDFKIWNYHLGVAIGEANEVMVYLDFLKDLDELKLKDHQRFYEQYEILAKRLSVLKSNNLKYHSKTK